MYNSERLIRAIGALSDDKIENAGRALGYQRAGRGQARTTIRLGKLLSIAAVAALILALGATAYGAYSHWSRGLAGRLPATEAEIQAAEASGLSDPGQAVSATAGGVTVSVEQTVIDSGTAWIALRIEGLDLPEGQYPDIGPGWSLTFDGAAAPNMGGSFAEERDAADTLRFAGPDGALEYDFYAKAGEDWGSFAGKEIRLVIDSLGTGDKGAYEPLAEGPWELVWTPSADGTLRLLRPDAAIGGTGARLVEAELAPLSVRLLIAGVEPWEGMEQLEPGSLQLAGLRLQDGSELLDVFGPPTSEGFPQPGEALLELCYSARKILQPEQIEALLFTDPAADTLIAVPIS